MMEPRWKPLLDGRVADEGWRVIWDIAKDLRNLEMSGYPSLGGAAGLTIFFAYLAQATDNDELADIAIEYLDGSLEVVSRQPARPSLYGGFTGPAWILEHLQGWLLEDHADDDESGDDLAAVLLEHLQAQRPTPGNEYDLISGLVGLCVYALEALPRPTALECLQVLVEHLETMADSSESWARWFTAPALLPDQQRKVAPNGYWNLGVAHGIPGVVGALARMHAAGVARARVQRLASKAVRWILDQRLEEDGQTSSIPNWIADRGDKPTRPGLAWCYGDLGVATVLMLAGRLMEEDVWVTEALEIARYAAARSMSREWRADAGLCHGAAGVAHLLNRIYQATGDEEIGTGARFWFSKTFDLQNPTRGYGGFMALKPPPDDPNQLVWEEDPGFLTGSAGVGLALLGAVSTLEPDWDRLLLANIPPRAC